MLNSKYEWHQHVWMSSSTKEFGGASLTDADHRAVEEGPASSHWNEEESLVLKAADELREDSTKRG